MPDPAPQPAAPAAPDAPGAPAVVAAIGPWRPGARWSGRHTARLAVGLALAVAFALWMVWQWRNPMVRLLAGTVTAVFLLVTARWLRDDLRGQRQRVARIEAGVLYLTTPTGPRVVPLGEVAFALWRDDLDVTNGLWFYDRRQQVLAHLDLRFLPDLAAARAFAAWLQLHAPQLEVRWPGQSRL